MLKYTQENKVYSNIYKIQVLMKPAQESPPGGELPPVCHLFSPPAEPPH